MTTSPTPWTTLAIGEGAIVKDALGNNIGNFKDWRDAEYAVGSAAFYHENQDAVARLRAELEDSEDEVERLRAELEGNKGENQKLIDSLKIVSEAIAGMTKIIKGTP